MLHLELDPRSAVPAYRQLMDQVTYYVASGALSPGDKLPSIREVARYLGVNPTTVVKAYTELAHESVIERQHGRGVFVRQAASAKPRLEIEKALRERARKLAVAAQQMGAGDDEVVRIVREELAALDARKPQQRRTRSEKRSRK